MKLVPSTIEVPSRHHDAGADAQRLPSHAQPPAQRPLDPNGPAAPRCSRAFRPLARGIRQGPGQPRQRGVIAPLVLVGLVRHARVHVVGQLGQRRNLEATGDDTQTGGTGQQLVPAQPGHTVAVGLGQQRALGKAPGVALRIDAREVFYHLGMDHDQVAEAALGVNRGAVDLRLAHLQLDGAVEIAQLGQLGVDGHHARGELGDGVGLAHGHVHRDHRGLGDHSQHHQARADHVVHGLAGHIGNQPAERGGQAHHRIASAVAQGFNGAVVAGDQVIPRQGLQEVRGQPAFGNLFERLQQRFLVVAHGQQRQVAPLDPGRRQPARVELVAGGVLLGVLDAHQQRVDEPLARLYVGFVATAVQAFDQRPALHPLHMRLGQRLDNGPVEIGRARVPLGFPVAQADVVELFLVPGPGVCARLRDLGGRRIAPAFDIGLTSLLELWVPQFRKGHAGASTATAIAHSHVTGVDRVACVALGLPVLPVLRVLLDEVADVADGGGHGQWTFAVGCRQVFSQPACHEHPKFGGDANGVIHCHQHGRGADLFPHPGRPLQQAVSLLSAGREVIGRMGERVAVSHGRYPAHQRDGFLQLARLLAVIQGLADCVDASRFV